jgi:GTP-binding protein
MGVRRRATVAIVGRPNVGKSTLFNRLLGRRAAVVHDSSGVTRDRHVGVVTWNDKHYNLVDTGGLLARSASAMERMVRDSALIAIEEADLLLVVLDVNVGVTDLDQELVDVVRKSGKPTLLVANKADDASRENQAHELNRLGLGVPQAVSAVHGTGCGHLQDAVLERLTHIRTDLPESDAELSIAIIGKPNAGKSSLLNALLGEERVLVSETPGTTRDAIDTRLQWHGHAIDIIDTAGLRRRGRIEKGVEAFAALRTQESIERADVCLLVLDATTPISHQDTHIAGLAHKASRGIVALFNKWDAVADKDNRTPERFRSDFEENFRFIRYAPVEFVSAKTHQRVHRLLETAWKVHEARAQRIATSQINRVLEAAAARNPPKFHAGGNGNVKYGLQVGTCPPRFAVYVNNPDYFDRNYVRYLNNTLRAAFPCPGSVLRIELRRTERSHGSSADAAPNGPTQPRESLSGPEAPPEAPE